MKDKKRALKAPHPLESMLLVYFPLPRSRNDHAHVKKNRNQFQQHWFNRPNVDASFFCVSFLRFPMFFASYCPKSGLTFPNHKCIRERKGGTIPHFLTICDPYDEFRASITMKNGSGPRHFQQTRYCLITKKYRKWREKETSHLNHLQKQRAICFQGSASCQKLSKIISTIFQSRYTRVTVLFEAVKVA